MTKKQRMVQIGVTASRAPDGVFLPSVPMYIKDEDVRKVHPNTNETVGEDVMLENLVKIFYEPFKTYMANNEKANKSKEG